MECTARKEADVDREASNKQLLAKILEAGKLRKLVDLAFHLYGQANLEAKKVNFLISLLIY